MDTAPALDILLQAGPLGAIVLWFAFRVEGRLDAFRASLDRMTRAQLLVVLASASADEPVKAKARELMAELPPVRPS